jgi:signal transduction histidine kinase
MRTGLFDATRPRARSRVPLAADDVAALHGSLDPGDTAFEIARVVLAVSGGASCAIWVGGGDEVTAAFAAVTPEGGGVRAVDDFAGRPAPCSPALADAFQRTGAAWTPANPALVPSESDGPVLLLPLPHDDAVVAVVALHGADPGAVDALDGVAEHAGAALGHALAFARRGAALADAERRVESLDVLHDLGGALAERGGSKALVDRLNRLLGDRGLVVDGLAWKSRAVARRVGGGDLVPPERTMLRDGAGWTTLADGRLAIAMRVGRKHLGSMRVRVCAPRDDAADIPFLELLAAGVAEVANRISLRAEVEEAARGTALAHERDRIAADLHDTAGQLFVAIQLLARREAEKLPRASDAAARFHRLADLANQGKWEIDHAIDALAFFPAARHGLAPAIRSLATSFRSDSGLDVIVDVVGRPVRLPAPAERALYRVVHESLANAWRHARCSVVRVALSFERERVHLTVTDDGTGLTETIPDRGRVGTSSMRRAMTDAGGTFHLRNAHPRGAIVEATIPRDKR